MALKPPLKAIRAFCLECSGTSNAVRDCPSSTCPLFEYRFGKRPNPVERTEAQKAAAVLAGKRLKERNLRAKEVEG